ncbi:MerR family transcriptional regulator [Paenibacillus sp. sptzw28]|uniref:MerR family transcriptional regulator n=1 Tax=Paenibacillus sp. sptzw28 TaxID=715179 RepID=UPI001C6EED2F|nr:MerR family transcriptional regulator [Paenibacillus sp. sptzw28]QYR21847.1 MerR family transcriptional regulator [Paenibacillus sp. sptzw28]
MSYKVKEVSEWAGVSVRTLHHYDEIGLVVPEAVTGSGHRLYSDGNLERLQQVLFFREIGFSLHEIKRIIESPDFDRKRALAAHRELLLEKKKRLEDIIATVELTLQNADGGMIMSQEELFNGFDMKDIEEHKSKYTAESREKYGDAVMDAVESRTSKYTQEDWARIHERSGQTNAKIIAAMDRGPADPQVQEGVAELRQQITDYYYDCTPEIFRGLADLYVDDPRFTKNIDKNKPGYAAFLREAMIIYCDNLKKQG